MHFGFSVSILADRALVGAFLAGDPLGSGYVFEREERAELRARAPNGLKAGEYH